MHTLLANATNPSIRKEKDLEKKKKKSTGGPAPGRHRQPEGSEKEKS